MHPLVTLDLTATSLLSSNHTNLLFHRFLLSETLSCLQVKRAAGRLGEKFSSCKLTVLL